MELPIEHSISCAVATWRFGSIAVNEAATILLNSEATAIVRNQRKKQ